MTTSKEALELKPCPFCGKPPKVSESGWHARIHCDNEYCGARVEVAGTERGIVLASWNTRATASLEGDAAEMVARIIDPSAWRDKGYKHAEWRIQQSLIKARAILATGLVPDEAAIRADEREKCAEDSNGVDPKLLEGKSELFVSIYCQARVDAAATIRSGGGE